MVTSNSHSDQLSGRSRVLSDEHWRQRSSMERRSMAEWRTIKCSTSGQAFGSRDSSQLAQMRHASSASLQTRALPHLSFFVPPSHPLVSGGLSDDRARCVWALEGSTGPLTYGIGLVRFLTLRETSQTVSRETFAAGRTIILVYASRRNAKRDGRSPHCT